MARRLRARPSPANLNEDGDSLLQRSSSAKLLFKRGKYVREARAPKPPVVRILPKPSATRQRGRPAKEYARLHNTQSRCHVVEPDGDRIVRLKGLLPASTRRIGGMEPGEPGRVELGEPVESFHLFRVQTRPCEPERDADLATRAILALESETVGTRPRLARSPLRDSLTPERTSTPIARGPQ